MVDVVIDGQMVSAIAGIVAAIISAFNAYVLAKVHTLTNSNFSEAKAARLAAEVALKAAQELNVELRKESAVNHAADPHP
jgi:hypothetical protein